MEYYVSKKETNNEYMPQHGIRMSQKHYTPKNKPDTKYYIRYDYIYIKF